jgi:hypothetical protein
MKRVVGPDGSRWRVGRRWVPWEPKLRKVHENLDVPAPEGCFVDALDEILVVIGAVIAIVVFVVFVLPVLLLLAELLLLALLVLLGVLMRIFLRRPWIVDAVRDATGQRHSWKVVGWRASGRLVERVTGQIATGQEPRPEV